MKRLPRTLVAALAVAAIAALPAAAKPPELAGRVEAARPAGCHDYSYLLWDLYRAELWSDAATLPGKSFALSLIYHTNFTRGSLVDSSIDEMARFSGGEPGRFAAARFPRRCATSRTATASPPGARSRGACFSSSTAARPAR